MSNVKFEKGIENLFTIEISLMKLSLLLYREVFRNQLLYFFPYLIIEKVIGYESVNNIST